MEILNSILNTGSFPSAWSSGMITPIYKQRGDKICTSNYRGITLLPVMAKVFTTILAERLKDWAEENEKLPLNQFGFRQSYRTTDAIFVIQTLIETSRNAKTPLLCCFVDLQKAFDSINQNKLWVKLRELGVSKGLSMYVQICM